MRYKGHVIEVQYLPGADFKVAPTGAIQMRSPKPCHIDFVTVMDSDGFRWNESNFADAKKAIDKHEGRKS